ncbi:hypothetical protein PVK06_021224 [Gossypium arboreum]|uniref:Uncharacterized protein n=1 Tax=Gossypium arboreum TaxID=29729 RepID=A0ABR0PPF5_GOSAR|nr:hypothetical protein PVK06_021224 [Gossypium arboreum]
MATMDFTDFAVVEPSFAPFNGDRVVTSFPRHEVVKLSEETYMQWQQQVHEFQKKKRLKSCLLVCHWSLSPSSPRPHCRLELSLHANLVKPAPSSMVESAVRSGRSSPCGCGDPDSQSMPPVVYHDGLVASRTLRSPMDPVSGDERVT